ncbi:MAG: hypothetical protein HRU75_12595 [Planctomycetia bacterium]|nr:MAG: hypothetical protein HRU75_12595 [Planctomycetia bacterium]
MAAGSRRDDFLLGLTALLLLSLLVGTVLALRPGIGGAMRPLVVHFPHRDGLAPVKPGSPVMLAGVVHVGEVTFVEPREVDGPPAAGRERSRELVIAVTANVRRDIPLYADCRITSDQPPVGGIGTLLILDTGTPAAGILGDAPLPGLPPQSFAAAIGQLSRRLLGPGGVLENIEQLVDPRQEASLVHKISVSLSDINALTAGLRTELDGAESASLLAKLHNIMDNVNLVTTALRQQSDAGERSTLVGKLHTLLDGLGDGLGQITALASENRPAIRQLTGSLASAAARVDAEILTRLRDELDRENPASLLGRLHSGMERVNASLADVVQITSSGRQLVLTNRPLLDRTLANVRDMSEQLRLTSQELRAAPWRLLYQPSERESREMTLFDAARTFAEAATYLDDAAARLQAAIEAAPPGTAEEARGVSEALRSAFDRFERAERFLYEQLR